MKRTLCITLLSTLGCSAVYATAPVMDKVSYALGITVGTSFKSRKMDIQLDPFLQGIKDSMTNQPIKMSDDEVRNTLVAYQKYMMQKTMDDFKASNDINQKKGNDFLMKNAKQQGIVSLPDGLQYKILTPGNGKKPGATDIITVNYAGRTLDDKEFDSSYKRGKPMTAPLSNMIPGWIEVVQRMKEGATWEVYIPAKLAYGEQGSPPTIGPNETLIFKINLIKVNKAAGATGQ